MEPEFQEAFRFFEVTVAGEHGFRLYGFDARIPLGCVTVVEGPSGSGKTTLLRLCNRLDVPDKGRIEFLGRSLEDWDVLRLRRRVAMVSQQPVVFEGSVADNLREASGEISEEEMLVLLEMAGLEVDRRFLSRRAETLSGGEAQRVCMARALATSPDVLLADEPTASVDRRAAETIEKSVRHLSDRGLTVVWVTHDEAQGKRLADYVIAMEDGRCIREGFVTWPET